MMSIFEISDVPAEAARVDWISDVSQSSGSVTIFACPSLSCEFDFEGPFPLPFLAVFDFVEEEILLFSAKF